MTVVDVTPPPSRAAADLNLRWLGAAAAASIGTGAIHAAAVGAHADSKPTAITFAALAVAQILWGGLALLWPRRVVALIGAVIGVGAVAGWAVAKTSGIGFIDGLEVAEPVQTADGLAAALAAASAVLVAVSFLRRGAEAPADWRRPMAIPVFGVTLLAAFGMVVAGDHAHGGSDHHGDESDGHGHATETVAGGHAAHGESAAVPVPFDPSKPIDLGGTPGVTPEQQAEAENLLAVTLVQLPQWSDPAVAESKGFRSIGDGFTGVEHLVNREFIGDDVVLDPNRPESLVYDTSGGGRRLVAAMYMLKTGTPLEDVPDVGGELMQWHTHENLCYNDQGQVRGLTDAEGNCAPGLTKPVPTPMIHVWIESHPCGPFAALEGVGGGTIREGETVLCDHAHGT